MIKNLQETSDELQVTINNPPRPSGTPPSKRRGIGATLLLFCLSALLLFCSTTLQAQNTHYATGEVFIDRSGFMYIRTADTLNLYNSTLQRFEELLGYTSYWTTNSVSAVTSLGASLNYYCNHLEIIEIKKKDAVSVRCVME